MRHSIPRHPSTRRGFTLVELLVVIAIIGILVALLIPAVASARARMRKATCLNNMREISGALINYETSKGRYPGYIEPVKSVSSGSPPDFVQWVAGSAGQEYVGSQFQRVASANDRSSSRVAWSAHLLPYIDRQDIWDTIQNGAATPDQRLLKPIGLYICPDDTDITSAEGAAGLSYVVNAGAWDWDDSGNFHGNDDPNENGETKENGLFHNLVEGNTKSRLSSIRDGASTTLMLSENMHKNPVYSWFGVGPNQLGEQHLGMVWVVNTAPAGDCVAGNSDDQAPFGDDCDEVTWPEDIPFFARPNSNHPGDSFNVMFADHHGASIGMDIDYIVYQQLLTTHGAKCVDPHEDLGTAPTGAILGFRNAPALSEADFE